MSILISFIIGVTAGIVANAISKAKLQKIIDSPNKKLN
jgi:uncharacterized membrane protein YeaQ/YmgE (transglycosylase-associated protein family)